MALEALLINPNGSTRARAAGYAELDRALAPGEQCEITMTVDTADVSGPVFLMFLMKDHCIADFPLKSGAWCLRPRWPALMRQAQPLGRVSSDGQRRAHRTVRQPLFWPRFDAARCRRL